MKNLVLCFVVAVFLAGCATGAKMESMAVNDAKNIQGKYDRALQKQVGVASVTGGEDTNPLWTSEISNDSFSGAVKSSLESQGLYSDDGKYQLQINLLQVEQPLIGFDMTVTTHVKYLLTDRDSGKVLLDETLVTPYTATVSDAFVGFVRLQLANEGSGKKNIEGLLNRLAGLKINPEEVSVVK
jgi:hypothetical protein